MRDILQLNLNGVTEFIPIGSGPSVVQWLRMGGDFLQLSQGPISSPPTAPPPVVTTPPTVVATQSLVGRTLTVSAVITGEPAPSVVFSLSQDGVPVTPGGSNPWSFTVPSSGVDTSLTWTILVNNEAGNASAFGQTTVPTDTVTGPGGEEISALGSLEGRTVTVRVLGLINGYTFSMTANGATVTPIRVGERDWNYEVPANASPVTIAWVASGVEGSASGSIVVTPDLSVPGQFGVPDWTLVDEDIPNTAPAQFGVADWSLVEDAVVATAPDAFVLGDWDLEFVADTPPPPPPPSGGGLTAPTAVTATTVNDRRVNVSWTNGGGSPTSHDVQWSRDQTNWTTVATVTSPAAITPLPSGGDQYFFRVIARNGANTATSATASATTHMRPYGLTAEWNIPIADVLSRGAHPTETYIRDIMWQGRGAGPGVNWINFFARDYTYPVYYSTDATTQATIATGFGNWIGRTIPWNPSWVIPAGTDNQIIILDEATGVEYNAWRIRYDSGTNRIVNATSGTGRVSRVTAEIDGSATAAPGDYRTKVNGFVPSRGLGLQYLALLVRPEEIAQGRIYHALGIPMHRSGYAYHCRPAYKSERSSGALLNNNGIPQGTRMWLDVSDAEINAHVNSWPLGVPSTTRNTMRIVFTAMRDYGFVANDVSGDNHIQFEHDASADWRPYGMTFYTPDGQNNGTNIENNNIIVGGRRYPRDAIDNFISDRTRLKVVRPPDGVLHYARWAGETNRGPTPLRGVRPGSTTGSEITMTEVGRPLIARSGSTFNLTRRAQFFGEHPVTINTPVWFRGSTQVGTGTSLTTTTPGTYFCQESATNANGTNTFDSNSITI